MERDCIHTGDAFDVLPELPAESVHACVTDPPYGLAFMGRDWDNFEPKEYQEWCEKWAREVKRVLKPGGHMLAFSGNRTHHRLFTGVEDAGFEIRDTITWHYGSGFPKALDVSKAIDKHKDDHQEERKKLGNWLRQQRESSGMNVKDVAQHFPSENGNITGCVSNWEHGHNTPTPEQWGKLKDILGANDEMDEYYASLREKIGKPSPDWFEREVTGKDGRKANESWLGTQDGEGGTWGVGEWKKREKAATDAAKKWDGFKTGLKPATEYVVVARKPFDGATVDCVLEHGTGALNIDGTRIETGGRPNITHGKETETRFRAGDGSDELPGSEYGGETTEGRYPSNVVFDETEAERLDREVGELEARAHPKTNRQGDTMDKYGDFNSHHRDSRKEYQSGGPSRYFYTSKASKAERTLDGAINNAHPTVKPADLMEWLVTLVTAEGQTVLDPFAGSGTTCRAAKDLGRRFVGVERQAKWADVARVRVGLTPNDPSVVRGDDAQHGLEAYE